LPAVGGSAAGSVALGILPTRAAAGSGRTAGERSATPSLSGGGESPSVASVAAVGSSAAVMTGLVPLSAVEAASSAMVAWRHRRPASVAGWSVRPALGPASAVVLSAACASLRATAAPSLARVASLAFGRGWRGVAAVGRRLRLPAVGVAALRACRVVGPAGVIGAASIAV
jgi:hypothetical protein